MSNARDTFLEYASTIIFGDMSKEEKILRSLPGLKNFRESLLNELIYLDAINPQRAQPLATAGCSQLLSDHLNVNQQQKNKVYWYLAKCFILLAELTRQNGSNFHLSRSHLENALSWYKRITPQDHLEDEINSVEQEIVNIEQKIKSEEEATHEKQQQVVEPPIVQPELPAVVKTSPLRTSSSFWPIASTLIATAAVVALAAKFGPKN